MATALPFHRAVVDDPAFAPSDPQTPFTVHTRWIETEFVNTIAPYISAADASDDAVAARESITVEVGGKRLEVVLPAAFATRRQLTGSSTAWGRIARGDRTQHRRSHGTDAGHHREGRGQQRRRCRGSAT